MKIKFTHDEIRKLLEIETPEFPKYVSPLINLANQYAQGTRPRVVGQMSELIKEFEGKTIYEWEKWYLKKNPNAIKTATDKIMHKLKEFQNSLNIIDEEIIKQWVRDLVIMKTFLGLKFQIAILKKGAELIGSTFRLAKPEEESKGVDGYIDNIPVSIKPHTYELKKELPEQIECKIITYRKIKNGIEVDYSEIIK